MSGRGPFLFLGYREDGPPGSTGIGCREAGVKEGSRGFARDWVSTGSCLFGFGVCYKLGQCVAQPIGSRGR